MDVSEKDKIELEKRVDDPADYSSSASMSSNWQFTGASVANSSLDLLPIDVQVPVCRGDLVSASSGPSVSMIESFGPWDHPGSSQSLDYCDINAQNNSGTSSMLGMGKCGPPHSLRNSIDGALEMGWHPSSAMLKGGIFLPNAPGMLPQSLSHIPADSAFIERAARFSSFNGGNFSNMVNPFRLPVSIGPYSIGGGNTVHGPIEVLSRSGLSLVNGEKTQSIMNVGEAYKDAVNCVADEGSPLKNERRSEGLVRSIDEGKQTAGPSGNDSDEDEFSGGGGGKQDELPMLEGHGGESSVKCLGSKKRKRSGQDTDHNQGLRNQQPGESETDNPETKPRADQNPTSTTAKTAGKHGKQGSQASDPQKEDYIHVRARRGQATNSHSLAERVRREKISERMKFLQDLVPGCSKVTGKAVMLDEIINYVQSLQRQVEFLSMKLATVNPRMGLNIEGLLAKDILHSRGVSSSALAFSPEIPMAYPSLNPSQPGLIPSGFPGMESHADILRRAMNTQLTPLAGGFKEPPQLPNAWDDELHNVVHLGYGTSAPQENQELSGTPPTDHMKMEL